MSQYMSSLSEGAAFASDYAFRPIIIAALEKVAMGVVAENPTTPRHAERLSLARKVLNTPENSDRLSQFAWAVSTDEDLVDSYTENDLEAVAVALPSVLEGLWNTLSE